MGTTKKHKNSEIGKKGMEEQLKKERKTERKKGWRNSYKILSGEKKPSAEEQFNAWQRQD